LEQATDRPWSPQEFSVLAKWLAANEKPLEIVIQASKRPRRYDPLCCGPMVPVIAVLLPAHLHHGNVARALHARAMLRLKDGEVEEAWGDLLACHRLARLIGQGPMIVDTVTAFGVDESTCTGDHAVLQHARPTATQIAKMLADLNRLPVMPKMADSFDVAERYLYLNVVLDASRQGPASLVGSNELQGLDLFDAPELAKLKDTRNLLIHYGATIAFDWDLILRRGNAWFDRIAEAFRKPTRHERKKALSHLEDEIRRLKERAEDAKSLDESMLVNPRQALSERFSDVLLTMFLPNLRTDNEQEDRWIMRFELDKLAFGLAAYHADRGTYPAKLAELAPHYVAEVKKDIFNDSELRYRLEGQGYLLYSVGINGKDDGARGYEERKENEDWDDLVVRAPATTEQNP
jgi:hypothetical protein